MIVVTEGKSNLIARLDNEGGAHFLALAVQVLISSWLGETNRVRSGREPEGAVSLLGDPVRTGEVQADSLRAGAGRDGEGESDFAVVTGDLEVHSGVSAVVGDFSVVRHVGAPLGGIISEVVIAHARLPVRLGECRLGVCSDK